MAKKRWALKAYSHLISKYLLHLSLIIFMFILSHTNLVHSQILIDKIYSSNLNAVSLHVFNTGGKYIIIDSTGFILIYNMSDLSICNKILLPTEIGHDHYQRDIAAIDDSSGKMYILGDLIGISVVDLNSETVLKTLPIRGTNWICKSIDKIYIFKNTFFPTLYQINPKNDQIDSFSISCLSIIHDMTINPLTNNIYFCGIGNVAAFDGLNNQLTSINNTPDSYHCEINYISNKLYLTTTTFSHVVLHLNDTILKKLDNNDAQSFRFDPIHNKMITNGEINYQISVIDGITDSSRIIQGFNFGYRNYGIVNSSGNVYISKGNHLFVIDSIYLKNDITTLPGQSIVTIDQINNNVLLVHKDSIFIFKDTLVPSPIREPSLINPENNAEIDSIDINFSWTQVKGADHYEGVICKDSTNDIFHDGCYTFTEETTNTQLTEWDTGTYYWSIYACYAQCPYGYQTPWSEIYKFRRVSSSNNFINNSITIFPHQYSCDLISMSRSRLITKYSLYKKSKVTIKIYNLQGKLLKTILDTDNKIGHYQILIDISTLSKGNLVLVFKADAFHVLKNIINL